MAEHFRDDSVAAVGVRIDAEHPQGMLFDPHQPQLRVTDLGAVRGDGIFETMYTVGGQVRKLRAHLERLARSAAIVGIGIPPAESWEAAVELGLDEYRERGRLPEELAVKLVATRGVEGEPASEDPDFAGTCWVLLTPVPEHMTDSQGTPISVALLDRGYEAGIGERAPWLLLGAKTLSYAVNMAALRHAAEQGYEDVIFTSSDGKVLEGPTSTVLISRQHEEHGIELLTPRPEAGILPGTTQGALYSAAAEDGWKISYTELTPEDLFQADHVWLVSSVRLVVPVRRIDEHELGVDPGLTDRLTTYLAEDRPVELPGL